MVSLPLGLSPGRGGAAEDEIRRESELWGLVSHGEDCGFYSSKKRKPYIDFELRMMRADLSSKRLLQEEKISGEQKGREQQ